jgi:hypothetical protein
MVKYYKMNKITSPYRLFRRPRLNRPEYERPRSCIPIAIEHQRRR